MKRGNKKLIQLKSGQKDTVKFRKQWWIRQNRKCALLKQKIPYSSAVVDHKHKLKAETPGPNGRGLVRGVLDHQANAFLGKIENAFKRYRMDRYGTLREVLEMVSDFVENPPMPQIYIHWSEKPKTRILMKSEYNLIVKHYFKIKPKARKIPEYPAYGIKYDSKGKPKQYKARMGKEWLELLGKAQRIDFLIKKGEEWHDLVNG